MHTVVWGERSLPTKGLIIAAGKYPHHPVIYDDISFRNLLSPSKKNRRARSKGSSEDISIGRGHLDQSGVSSPPVEATLKAEPSKGLQVPGSSTAQYQKSSGTRATLFLVIHLTAFLCN